MIVPVILSGGSGSRLWPLSRALYPKQLLQLTGDGTMLQETVQRSIVFWSQSSCVRLMLSPAQSFLSR